MPRIPEILRMLAHLGRTNCAIAGPYRFEMGAFPRFHVLIYFDDKPVPVGCLNMEGGLVATKHKQAIRNALIAELQKEGKL